jgi:hypothetical protein
MWNSRSVIVTVKITCYFHCENYKTDCDVMSLIMTLCCVNALKRQTCSKNKDNVINIKFNALLMNMEFISLVRKNPVSLWNKFHIHQQALNISPINCATPAVKLRFFWSHPKDCPIQSTQGDVENLFWPGSSWVEITWEMFCIFCPYRNTILRLVSIFSSFHPFMSTM